MSRIRVKRATIVSMDPALGIIELGDLLIDRDKIIAVGRDIGSWAVREIDGRGMIAMPGFINGHIHLWQTALRGIAADWTLDQYFGVLIGKAVRLYTPQDGYIGNLVGALDQINSGITTFSTGAISSTRLTMPTQPSMRFGNRVFERYSRTVPQ